MNPTEMRILVDQYLAAYNDMDIPRMLATVHPDVEFKNISQGKVNVATYGIKELQALAEQSKSLFSERKQIISSFETADNSAVASITFCAVVAIDLPNGVKKGEVLNLKGRSEFTFKDGKIFQITDIS
jgi:ketosteroid isomerase-like protein